jgi:hypothetical protein
VQIELLPQVLLRADAVGLVGFDVKNLYWHLAQEAIAGTLSTYPRMTNRRSAMTRVCHRSRFDSQSKA